MTVQNPSTLSSLASTKSKLDWGWAHGFVILQFVLQLLLLFPQFGVLRVPMRMGAFALGLFLLVWVQGQRVKHPATRAAVWVLGVLALSFCLNPFMNSVVSGLAQAAMYIAILSPLFWGGRLKLRLKGFEQLILLIWGFHSLSALFGVLQTYFPGQLQPYLSTTIQKGAYGGSHLLITLANGMQVYRPMGLTDTPGGAAISGFYALMFGIGIAFCKRNGLIRLICAGSATVGLLCIYLSQIRSVLVFAAICVVCFAIVLLRQGSFGRFASVVTASSVLAVMTFGWAIAIGGESTLERIVSLTAENPGTVVYQNRGRFLENTLTVLLPQYPLGAGLGRWGMMNNYFGDNTHFFSQPIWVEIQWTGWLLDGGIPLILAYVAALYCACRTAWRIALNPRIDGFRLWGGLIFAYNIGALAITFNYPLFIGQSGMEFWLLNSTLFTAFHNQWMEQHRFNETANHEVLSTGSK